MANDPLSAEEVKKLVLGLKERAAFQNFKIGIAIVAINKLAGGDDNRHKIFKFLFGKESTKDLTSAERYAIYKWVSPRNIDHQWAFRATLKQEVESILGFLESESKA